MAGEVRSSLPRVRKQSAQVPADCVPSTGYVPMGPMMPGEPEGPGQPPTPVGAPLWQSAQPPLSQPFDGSPATPVADGFGPGPDAPSTPLLPGSTTVMQPAPGSQMVPAHALAGPAGPVGPAHTVRLMAVPAGDAAAAVPATPAPPTARVADDLSAPASAPHSTPLNHPVAGTSAPEAHNLSTPLGSVDQPITHNLMAHTADKGIAPSSGDGHGPGCPCCGQNTADQQTDAAEDHQADAAAQPDASSHAQDPAQPAGPSDTSQPGTGTPDSTAGASSPSDTHVSGAPDTTGAGTQPPADPGNSAGNSPGSHAAGAHDSPVQVDTAAPGNAAPPQPERMIKPETTPQSQDPTKPFYKSEKPPMVAREYIRKPDAPVTPGSGQPLESGKRVQAPYVPGTPGATPPMAAAETIQAPNAPVTPGAAQPQPLDKGLMVKPPDDRVPLSPATISPKPGADTGSSGQSGSDTGGKGSDTGGAGSGAGSQGSGTGGDGGKKTPPPVRARSGGNLTFDENKYKQLTNVINDMTTGLVKSAAQTATMALDVELALQAGNKLWHPAGHVTDWTKNFGQSVSEVNDKMRVALNTLSNALSLASTVFKDTADLAQLDFGTFVTEFPDFNTGGGQINPGAYGAFGGGATGGKN